MRRTVKFVKEEARKEEGEGEEGEEGEEEEEEVEWVETNHLTHRMSTRNSVKEDEWSSSTPASSSQRSKRTRLVEKNNAHTSLNKEEKESNE
jgi:hypothetical protein